MSKPHRTLLVALAVGLWGCAHEPDAEPARAPNDVILLPSWVDDTREQAKPSPSQKSTVVLGETPFESDTGRHASNSYGSSSVHSKFRDDGASRIGGRGFYRPYGAGAGMPRSAVPPVGGNWPTIPNHGPAMPTTTPVHPR